MMKEERFFKEMPYPFKEDEERRIKNKILSSIPEDRLFFFPKLAFSGFIIILIIISFSLHHKKEKPFLKERISVKNPLKMKFEEIKLPSLPVPELEAEEKVEDIPFQITKVDHHIKLQWEDRNASKFRIKKCFFPPGKEGCVYLEETDKRYFIDNCKEEEKLVFYIVEAIRS